MPDAFAVPAADPVPGPHLFFGAGDVPRLRANYASPLFAGLRASLDGLDRAALRRQLGPDLDPTDHLSSMLHLGLAAERCALHHLLTGDPESAELARATVGALMRFRTWDFFVDRDGRTIGSQRAPSTIIAVACALDWLGDAVPAEERRSWLAAIAGRGCPPCQLGLQLIRHPREDRGWLIDPASSIARVRSETHTDGSRRAEITQTTNLRAVPAMGLALGAVTLARHGYEHPDLSAWLKLAIDAIRAFGRIYEPDGSYDEGVHYADYTGRSLIVAITALQRAGVADLRDVVNWRGHARYLLNLSLPTAENPHDVVNISDNGYPRLAMIPAQPPETRSALPFWIARECRDGVAQWYGRHRAAGHNPWSLIFHDETVAPVAPAGGPQSWRPDIEWLVARTGFAADDLVVSLRSGRGANHEHADRNSLIVKYRGEPLVVDPLRPPYSYADPSWRLRETEGHSAVLVGGMGHHYHNGVEGTNATPARARVTRHECTAAHAIWVSDASHAYRLRDAFIRSVVRGVVILFDLPVVLVVDRVTRWRGTSTIEARFMADNWAGQAALTVSEGGFRIARPRARLVGRVFSREPLHLATGRLPIPAERAELHPYVGAATPDVPAATLVTALFPGAPDDPEPGIAFTATPDGITVRLADGRTIEIGDQGDSPEIVLR